MPRPRKCVYCLITPVGVIKIGSTACMYTRMQGMLSQSKIVFEIKDLGTVDAYQLERIACAKLHRHLAGGREWFKDTAKPELPNLELFLKSILKTWATESPDQAKARHRKFLRRANTHKSVPVHIRNLMFIA